MAEVGIVPPITGAGITAGVGLPVVGAGVAPTIVGAGVTAGVTPPKVGTGVAPPQLVLAKQQESDQP